MMALGHHCLRIYLSLKLKRDIVIAMERRINLDLDLCVGPHGRKAPFPELITDSGA